MISVSQAFINSMEQNTSALVKATLTLADGTVRELSGDDFMMGGVSLTQAVSSSGSFDIGAAVIGSCSITLNNIDGRFDEVDFTGATVKPYIGKELPDGTTEWVRRQEFSVDQPDSYGNSIVLSGLDAMSAFERPYSDAGTKYPASLGTIVADICRACGVTLASTEFPNRAYSVVRRPSDDSLTCLAVLSYAAQVAGCWCLIDNSDRLVVKWYDTAIWEKEAWLDGGSFDGSKAPYEDGDAADGGDFTSYGASAETNADGGEFDARPYISLSAFSSLTLCTDDVVVTGVRVTASDDLSEEDGGTGAEGETALSGEKGYVLSIAGNPLVLYGQAKAVADYLDSKVAGMRFRPFSASALGDPSVEAGDPVMVIDAQQRAYRSYLTSYTYKLGGYASAACSAETPSRNSATSFSAATKAIVDLRNSLKKEQTARQQAIDNLNKQLSDSSGLFTTAEKQSDGSVIYYQHDKPTLAESKIVWKFTAEAVGISTDGGKTYAHGLDVSGDAILNRVYAIGIDADYVNTGRISDRAGKNFIDLDTGEVSLSATATAGGKEIAVKEETISSVDVQYAQGSSATTAPTTGWQTSAPAWSKGKYIWQRTKTVAQDGTASYSQPVMISGRDGQDGGKGDDGDQGIGVSAIIEQYYLSTSGTAQAGGSWSTAQPAWSKGKYIWTRSQVTWTDKKVTYTAPVLAKAINGANQAVSDLDEGLDQEGVFNRLTNNGQTQGIYMSGGKLYLNGTYMQMGTIDAKKVAIANLMSIGDDKNSVNVSDNAIDFTVNEVAKAMHIGANSFSTGRDFFYSQSGYVQTIPAEESGAKSYALSKKVGPYKIQGGNLPLGLVTVKVFGDRARTPRRHTVKKEVVLYSNQTIYLGEVFDGVVQVELVLGRSGDSSIRLSRGAGNSGVPAYIDTVEVVYTIYSLGGEITTSGGETFLTNNNFGSEMFDGKLFSGEVRTSFIWNNIYRQHVLMFRNGLLIDYRLLTQSDPGFKDGYLG